MATMPREAAKAVRKYSKAVIQPEWKKELAAHAPAGRMFQSRLVRPSSALVSDRGVKLTAGRNGALVRETEFGAAREQKVTYMRRGRNGTYRVTRRTARQFYHHNRDGYVVFPTVREMIPRIASLWVQTIYRSVHEVIENQLGK
jgi:ribosomal protein L27